jgi:hypothetical protein
MQVITIAGEIGLFEAVAFPGALRNRQRPFRVDEIVCVRGRSTRQDGLAVLEVQGEVTTCPGLTRLVWLGNQPDSTAVERRLE